MRGPVSANPSLCGGCGGEKRRTWGEDCRGCRPGGTCWGDLRGSGHLALFRRLDGSPGMEAMAECCSRLGARAGRSDTASGLGTPVQIGRMLLGRDCTGPVICIGCGDGLDVFGDRGARRRRRRSDRISGAPTGSRVGLGPVPRRRRTPGVGTLTRAAGIGAFPNSKDD